MTATVASHARRRTVAAAKKSARNNNKLLCIDLLRQPLHLSPFTPMIQHGTRGGVVTCCTSGQASPSSCNPGVQQTMVVTL